jgi:hypothetical protein
MTLTCNDMFGELIKPGDTVWSLEVNQEFEINIYQWLLEQVHGPTSVSVIFTDGKEKRRSVKSIRILAKDKSRLVNYMIDNLNKQKAKYEENLQKLESILEQNEITIAINNTEEEI